MNTNIDSNEIHRENVEARRNDSRSTEELIHLALTAEDEDTMWELVPILWYRDAGEVLAVSQQLVASNDPKRRQLGANILGQLDIPERVSPHDSLAVLLPLLEQEQNPAVLSAIAVALGHIGDPRIVEPLTRLKNHLDSDVRFGVVQGLSGQNDESAIASLIELSTDPDPQVRDWATFELGSIGDTDTPAVRDALWMRVSDQDNNTRREALRGLAKRGDARVVEPLLEELAQARVDGNTAGYNADEESAAWYQDAVMYDAIVEAGKQLGDPRLYQPLLSVQGLDGQDAGPEDLVEALNRCKPKTL